MVETETETETETRSGRVDMSSTESVRPPASAASEGVKKKVKIEEEELSEEEQKVKDTVDALVQRAQEGDDISVLAEMKVTLQSGEASLTSVPLELKYMRKHYQTLREVHEKATEGSEFQRNLADILSLLATTFDPVSRDTLRFKLMGNRQELREWGHEYIRHLSGDIGREFEARLGSEPVEELLDMVKMIVPFEMEHNGEPESCDLLMEVDMLPFIVDFCDERNFDRVCQYLISCSSYLPEPEDLDVLKVALDIYTKLGKYPNALRVAMRLNDHSLINKVFELCEDELVKKQLGFMLARQRFLINVQDEELNDIISNSRLSEYFHKVAEELEATDAKTPEDVYKTHLTETRSAPGGMDSAKQNLASTIVNGFLNAGFGKDSLMTVGDDKWLYRNKDHGQTAASASVGMIHMWDVFTGFAELDRYRESEIQSIKAGSLIGMGLCLNGVRSSYDPALTFIQEAMTNRASRDVRIGGIIGLGLAYAGSLRSDVGEYLETMVTNIDESIEVCAFAALSLGLVYAASSNGDVAESILLAMLERDEEELGSNTVSRFLSLALGLVFLGKQEEADTIMEAIQALTPKIRKFCEYTVDACAYAGTGNVLKIQKLMEECGQHYEEEDERHHMSVAVIGIALVAMGEKVGSTMLLRSFEHMLQYCDIEVRRGVPLALGLLSVSNPQIQVMDTLSKLSHDNDHEVSMGAILGLGLIGAGTSNSRIAGLLRQLSTYYQREANHLFIVRISQGLLYMGKGTMTLQPFHSDGLLMSPVAVAGLITLLHSACDMPNILCGKHSSLFYFLACAMYPRFLVTVGEDLEPVKCPVRVGQAVDTVAQVGRPRTISGFQTHDTPVLVAFGERAELAAEDMSALTPVLEGVVIVKKEVTLEEVD